MLEKELLSACGLSTTEQTVLLDLLEREGSTAGALSKRLNLKRSTTYSALQNLEDLGLVLRNQSANVIVFSTILPTMVPQILRDVAKRQYEDVARASKLLETHMASYRRKSKQKVKGYEISTTDSRDTAFNLIYEVIIENDFCSIFDPQSATTGGMENYIIDFIKTISHSRPSIREIIIEGPRGKWYLNQIRNIKPKNPNHQVKILPSKYAIITDFVIANDSVYLTNYNPGSEMLIQIKHKDYYDSMMSLFNFFWEHLPEA